MTSHRAFSRVNSEPATVAVNHRMFMRSNTNATLNSFGGGQRKGQLRLFLAANQISMLPIELFCLNSLVVLSLRAPLPRAELD